MRMALYTEGVTEHNTLSGEIYIVLEGKYRDGESEDVNIDSQYDRAPPRV